MMETPQYAVLTVMGPHAGEDSDVIFSRKIADIRAVGRTFWLIRSHKAKPDMVQRLCSTAFRQWFTPLCLFLEPSSPGGAAPTKTSSAATNYSSDGTEWRTLPQGIGPVTGQITRGACALVFDQLSVTESQVIDLWHYTDFFDQAQPVKIRQGASTVCVVRQDTRTHLDRMKSHLRRVMGIGRLTEPFAVWLK